MSRIISLYLLIVATLLQLGSTTDPASALSDLKSGVRFLRGILNHGTRVTLLPSIKYLSPMLEILRLRADIEKDAAVHKVLVHLEDSICEEVEEKTREVACNTAETQGVSIAMRAQMEVTHLIRALTLYKRSSRINECKWARDKNMYSENEAVNEYLEAKINGHTSCKFYRV